MNSLVAVPHGFRVPRGFRYCSLILSLMLSGCSATSESPEVAVEKANMLQARGQFEDAIAAYNTAAEKLPDRADVLFSRGLCYEQLRLFEKALQDYSRCLELDPGHMDALNNKGVVLASMQRFEEAAEQFTLLLHQSADNVLTLRNRGLCFHDLGRFDEAMADYNRGIELAPEDPETWFQRGNLFLEQGQPADAVSDFTRSIELSAEHARAWMNRGVARYKLGQLEAAVSDLEHARELDSNIVIPGLDWVSVGTVTEVVAARPVLAPAAVSQDWSACLSFAIAHLADHGYAETQTSLSLPESRCARLSAVRNEQPVDVYVAFAAGEEPAEVIIPSISDDAADGRPRTLIVIGTHTGPEPDAGEFRVLHLIENWQPKPDQVTPETSRLQLK
ncbi:MAG: tetratricopeptide repeat protein [Fuerstiella sp.]